jgi:hypothetical protein|tara:strand:- start:614 stop:862 length:249 start_codon:yes stop_codon:yes gene_type:complete
MLINTLEVNNMKNRITIEHDDLHLLVYVLENMNNAKGLEYCLRENKSIINNLTSKFRKNIAKNYKILGTYSANQINKDEVLA